MNANEAEEPGMGSIRLHGAGVCRLGSRRRAGWQRHNFHPRRRQRLPHTLVLFFTVIPHVERGRSVVIRKFHRLRGSAREERRRSIGSVGHDRVDSELVTGCETAQPWESKRSTTILCERALSIRRIAVLRVWDSEPRRSTSRAIRDVVFNVTEGKVSPLRDSTCDKLHWRLIARCAMMECC